MNRANHNTSASSIGELKEQFPSETRQKVQTAEREAKAAIGSARDKGLDLIRSLKSEIEERPYVGMGITFGLGIVAGALFGSRATRIALIGAVGYLVSRLPLSEVATAVRAGLARKA